MRIAIVGCGAVTDALHLPAILARSDIRLSAAVDRNPERAQLIAQKAGARAFGTVAEALPHFEAAIVALPHHLHASVSIELLEAGKHVLVEKPMAITSAECDAMTAASTRGRASLTIGQMRRFCPAVAAAKVFLEQERIGRISRFELLEGNIYDWPVASDFFFRKETAGGGVLLDTGAHTFDMLLWLFGEIAEVDYRDDAFGGVEADCQVKLKTLRGAEGYVELSRTRNLPTELIVEGERGRLVVAYKENLIKVQLEGQRPKVCKLDSRDSTGRVRDIWTLMIRNQLDDWIQSIRNGRPALVTGEEGRKTVEFIERCYQHRRPLTLPWLQPALTEVL